MRRSARTSRGHGAGDEELSTIQQSLTRCRNTHAIAERLAGGGELGHLGRANGAAAFLAATQDKGSGIVAGKHRIARVIENGAGIADRHRAGGEI